MSVADWFQTFCRKLQVSNAGTISSRYQAITQRLNTDFWNTTSETAHSLYVGSYGRNTATDGFSDLDMIFQLPASQYEKYDKYASNGQSALLQAVKTSIERTYSTTSIRADGQVIVVPFKDGISFEVVPGFDNVSGTFTFPDANGGGVWRTTDPKPEIKAIRDRNAETNGNLVWLCRMARQWKQQWSVPIGGLLIDTLAYQFIETWAYKDKSFLYYDYLCRDFFSWLANQSLELGITKEPQPFLVAGAGELLLASSQACPIVLPFVGVANQAVEGYRGEPSWVLTIENLTTFHLAAKRLFGRSDGLIVYTGGMPSPAWCRAYRHLLASVSSDVPIYHWGDFDEGGFRIAGVIKRAVLRDLRPWQMDPTSTKGQSVATTAAVAASMANAADRVGWCELGASVRAMPQPHVAEQEGQAVVLPHF